VQRLYLAGDALGFYLAKVLLPFRLAVDYGRMPQVVLSERPLLDVSLGMFAVLGLVAALATRRRSPALAGLVIALACFLPTSGLVPFAFQRISTVSDRYLYLPMIGLSLAFAGAVEALPRRLAWVLAGAAVLVAASLTCRRIDVWRDDKTFFEAMLAANPRSFSAQNGLGNLAMAGGRDQEALDFYEASLAEQPRNVLALANVALALAHLGRYDEVVTRIAPLVPDDQVARTHPLSAQGIARLVSVVGYAEVQTGRRRDGLASYCRAARIDPGDTDIGNNVRLLASQLVATGEALPDPCARGAVP